MHSELKHLRVQLHININHTCNFEKYLVNNKGNLWHNYLPNIKKREITHERTMKSKLSPIHVNCKSISVMQICIKIKCQTNKELSTKKKC